MVLPQRKEAALRACGTQPEVRHTFFASGVAGQNPSAHPSGGVPAWFKPGPEYRYLDVCTTTKPHFLLG